MRGHGDADARHRRGQHRAVGHRRRPRHRPLGPAVDRRRLHPHAGGNGHHGGLAGRPLRPTPALRHRARPLHRHLAAVRRGAVDHDAQRLARGAGRRRGDHVRGLARRALQRLPAHRGARQGARCLRGDDGRLLRRRAAGGRRAHFRPRLALDLPHQPPARPDVRVDRPALRRRVDGSARRARRSSGPRHAHRRPLPARLRAATRQRGRLGEYADRGLLRRRRPAAVRVRRRRGARRASDAAAEPLPQPVVHRRAGGGLRDLRVAVRDVALHDAVPPADPRPLGDRGRPRVRARDDAQLLRRGRHGIRRPEGLPARADRGRPDAGRRRSGAADDRCGGLVVVAVPARSARRDDRHRHVQPGPQPGRAELGAARAERPRRGRQRHVPPSRHRGRRRGAGRARPRRRRPRRGLGAVLRRRLARRPMGRHRRRRRGGHRRRTAHPRAPPRRGGRGREVALQAT